MTREEQITSLRGTLEWMKDELEVIEAEVDPILEAGAILFPAPLALRPG